MAAQPPHNPHPSPSATTMSSANPRWYPVLARWALLTGLTYAGLMLLFITLVLPAGRASPLPAPFLELIAAGRQPVLYRLTIALDVASWLMLGGFLITLAAVFRHRAVIRSTFIAALGTGTLVGFFGACLRLAGTTDLGDRYLTATADQQAALLNSYLDLQRLVNTSFSAGGLVAGIALGLAASFAWQTTEFPRTATTLIALGGLLHTAKGATELVTAADLGPLALLGNTLLIISFGIIAGRHWRQPPTNQTANTPDASPIAGQRQPLTARSRWPDLVDPPRFPGRMKPTAL